MKKNKLEINLMLYIFLFFSLVVVFSDIITYLVNINYIYTMIISFVFGIGIAFLLKNKINITNNFSKLDLIFYVLLFILFLVSIVYPDRTFDTFNYHLYLQEKPFGDKIFSDFFAAKNLNSFTYAFTDRLFYFFRYIFGYRLGVIFNYITLMTIYYQSKKIFKNVINGNQTNLLICIFSILCTFTLSTVELVDSYYVDNISIVYFSELFFLTFFYKNNNYKKIIPYIGLLCGFTFVSKISNAFIIILLFIFYIIKHKDVFKNIYIKDILLTAFLFIIPIFIYVYYTYKSTGNPVFPFYNTIFKSKFYANSNWLDLRFGPSKLIEVFIWPILMQFYPGRSYDTSIVEPMWAIGYGVALLAVVIFVIKQIKNKNVTDNLILYIFIIFSYLVWSKFMLGYTRYGLSVLYFSMIGIFIFLYYSFQQKRKIFIIPIIILLIFNYGSSLHDYLYRAHSWTFSNVFSEEHKFVSYKNNLKKIFVDRDYNIKLPNNSIIGILYYNAGYVSMITDDIPIISLNSGVSNEETEKILNSYLKSGKKIYSVVDTVDFDNFISCLNDAGYKIKDVYGVYNTDLVLENNFTYIFEIEKSNYQDKYFEFSSEYTIDLKEGKYNISFYGGLGKYMRSISFDSFNLELDLIDDNGSYQIIDNKEFGPYNGNLELYFDSLYVKDNQKVMLRITNDKHETVEYLAMMILNLNIEEVK